MKKAQIRSCVAFCKPSSRWLKKGPRALQQGYIILLCQVHARSRLCDCLCCATCYHAAMDYSRRAIRTLISTMCGGCKVATSVQTGAVAAQACWQVICCPTQSRPRTCNTCFIPHARFCVLSYMSMAHSISGLLLDIDLITCMYNSCFPRELFDSQIVSLESVLKTCLNVQSPLDLAQ